MPHPQPSPPPTTKQFVFHDTPCLNCGRYGCIPGQMISDSLDNTFCSPDCGWSFHLRPYQHESARAAAAAAMRTAARRHKSSRRKSSKPKHSASAAHHPPEPAQRQVKPSGKRPPRLPNRPLSAAERAANACLDTGNAMFDHEDGSNWWQ